MNSLPKPEQAAQTPESQQQGSAPVKNASEERATAPQTPSESPKAIKKSGSFGTLFFRLSVKDKMLFSRHMEMMTRSGLQVLESLEILRKQTRSRAFLKILDSLIDDVKNGHYLSVGMERFRQVFGDFIINLVRVGESSGTLSENFKYLSVELQKKSELRKKVVGALVYPIVIGFATFGITGIMVFVIFPRILPVLESLNVDLPLATRVFIALSSFAIANVLWILLGLTVLVIAWVSLLRIRSFRKSWHSVLVRIPLIGPLVVDVNVITIARTMSLLLKGGVQIVEAIEISGRSLNNLVFIDEMNRIADAVRQGNRMSKRMISNPTLFPPTFAQMTNVGETTGKLDETYQFLAEFYESELDGATKTLSNVLEPILLLGMGIVVSFVAISIVTPIYQISQTLGR